MLVILCTEVTLKDQMSIFVSITKHHYNQPDNISYDNNNITQSSI